MPKKIIKKNKVLSFQDIIMNLQKFWGKYGCLILQPYDIEVGAGTFHPATTLRSLGSKLKDPEKNNVFTGEFWTGTSALKLGLIDGLGNADQILKEKFGEEVVIKNFEKPKSWIGKKLSASIDGQLTSTMNSIEEKFFWQKFGL